MPHASPAHRFPPCSRPNSRRSMIATSAAKSRAASRLRAELKRRGLDGFVVPRADRHQNEYVPPCEERLAWLTGFTGSAGAPSCSPTAPRCSSTAATRCRPRADRHRGVHDRAPRRKPPEHWLEQQPAGRRQARLRPVAAHRRRRRAARARPARTPARRWSPCEANPVDAIWTDRPAPPLGKVVLHDIALRRRTGRRQIARIRAEIDEVRADALVVSDPHSRRLDLQHPRRRRRPYAAAARLRSSRARAGRALYVDGRKLDNAVRHKLEELAEVREPAALDADLGALGKGKHRAARPGHRGATRCRQLIEQPAARSRAAPIRSR